MKNEEEEEPDVWIELTPENLEAIAKEFARRWEQGLMEQLLGIKTPVR